MSEFDPEIFKKNLTFYRKAKGLKQRELAELSGTSISNIGGYESGKAIPPLPVTIKIAQVLSIKVDQLFASAQSPVSPNPSNIVEDKAAEYLLENARLKEKVDFLARENSDLRREINTLRAYTSRLEKDLQKYEEN